MAEPKVYRGRRFINPLRISIYRTDEGWGASYRARSSVSSVDGCSGRWEAVKSLLHFVRMDVAMDDEGKWIEVQR